MKLHHLNHIEGLTVEQFAIEHDEAIVGGFTLYTNPLAPTWSMMGGLHVNKPCSRCGYCKGAPYKLKGIMWIFKALKLLYPKVKTLEGFRSTGRKRGPSSLKWT